MHNHIIQSLDNIRMLKDIIIKSIHNAPEGKLFCRMNHRKYPQYYYCKPSEDPSEDNAKYISKSEKLIADKLFYKGIPYIYEAPLVLNNYTTFFPDFTILNIKERKTIYYEHFGMMDNPDYCKKALSKIETYEENGYHQFDQFVFSMESNYKSISMTFLDEMISRYFM